MPDTPLAPEDLQRLIDAHNAPVIDAIVRSLRSPTGVIPFVGAGMSHDFGAPMWGDFLELAAVSDDEKAAVARLVKDGKYEDAAQMLDAGPHGDRFRALVSERLDVEVDPARRSSGPLSLLPLLTAGPVITTNFDRVLEAFYEAADRPFPTDGWIAGRQDPIRILDSIQQNRHSLIKLHGDVRDVASFTFTALEYDESYGSLQRGTRGVLTELGNVIYTNRPLLFLGCSLEKDRTLSVLEQVASQNRFLTHYAVLAAPATVRGINEREQALKRAGIVPLWFAPGKFQQIGALLDRLVARASMEPIRPEPDGVPAGQAVTWRSIADTNPPVLVPSAELTAAHTAEVARAAARGELAFFFGAAVNNTRVLGNRFYEMLATRLNVPPPDRNRADVAEQLVDLAGRPALSDAIADIASTYFVHPWLSHKLIASLARRDAPDVQPPVVAFTTNYDDVLERTLAAAGVPYHLFLYQPDGPHAGRFVHRSPAGDLRAIVNPDGVYALDAAPAVVVKLNGGLDPLRELPGRFVVASRDFVEFANRIPAVLPRVIRQYLSNRSLLFLGHGLFEPDVRAFARYARAQRGARPSWAVQNRKRDAAYWRDSCGVDIREADLDTYLIALHRALKDDFGIDT